MGADFSLHLNECGSAAARQRGSADRTSTIVAEVEVRKPLGY